MILFIFIYLPFTFTVTLTFWPGFNPVTVAFAEFLVVDVAGFLITAFDGTFAAAAFAAVATFGRAALTFMRNKPNDTFTSLLE
jgi:hypothetical protein